MLTTTLLCAGFFIPAAKWAGGTDISEFANGYDACNHVNQLEYLHLLVTDLVMPKMRGDELIPKVRERFPKVPIVLVSGGNDDALKSAKDIAYQLSVRFYEKPITNISGFIETIRNFAPKQRVL